MSTTNTMTATTVFLDFDGVLHPDAARTDQLFMHKDRLEAVLRQHAVEIVVSSSWRMHFSLAGMRDLFSNDIAALLIDVTPSIAKPSATWLPGQHPEWERQWECETWLKANRPWGHPHVFIDDREHWFRPGCPNLLLVDGSTGMNDHNAVRLSELLLEMGQAP